MRSSPTSFMHLAQAHGRIRSTATRLLAPHLTDKVNEAIASPARFQEQAQGSGESATTLATQDYENQDDRDIPGVPKGHQARRHHDGNVHPQVHRRLGRPDRRTHPGPFQNQPDLARQAQRLKAPCKSGTGPLPVPPSCWSADQESDNPTPEPWHTVESRIAQAVRADIPTLESYGLNPVDQYLAAFGPALQVISEHWGTERAVANPEPTSARRRVRRHPHRRPPSSPSRGPRSPHASKSPNAGPRTAATQ